MPIYHYIYNERIRFGYVPAKYLALVSIRGAPVPAAEGGAKRTRNDERQSDPSSRLTFFMYLTCNRGIFTWGLSASAFCFAYSPIRYH